ncbi:hypothetical protein [Halomicrobium salinisoli]|uniref:hypothetical protein n=1 Tax=Halomicrobium salinisoli TaxID=2878391 RepID=UPI001CF00233|nr:hypothetical protein [Halomicrobium salinisoli]
MTAEVFWNKQFAIWMAISVSMIGIGSLAAKAVGLSTIGAFVSGFALSIPLGFLRDWLQDWEEVEQEAQSV